MTQLQERPVAPASPEQQRNPEKRPNLARRAAQKTLEILGIKPKNEKRRRISGFTALGVTAGAVTAAVLGPNMTAPPQEQETEQTDPSGQGQAGGEVVDTEDPGEDEPTSGENGGEELPETFDYGIEKSDIEPYLGMSQDQILALPPEERANIPLYYLQNLPEFSTKWQGVTKREDDKITAEFAHPENLSDEQIIQFITYTHRVPYTISVEGAAPGHEVLDANAANHMIAGSLIEGANSSVYNMLTEDTQEFVDFGGSTQVPETMAVSNNFPMPIINSKSERFTDANGRLCIKFNITEPGSNGKSPVTGDIVACLVTSTKGASGWFQAN